MSTAPVIRSKRKSYTRDSSLKSFCRGTLLRICAPTASESALFWYTWKVIMGCSTCVRVCVVGIFHQDNYVYERSAACVQRESFSKPRKKTMYKMLKCAEYWDDDGERSGICSIQGQEWEGFWIFIRISNRATFGKPDDWKTRMAEFNPWVMIRVPLISSKVMLCHSMFKKFILLNIIYNFIRFIIT